MRQSWTKEKVRDKIVGLRAAGKPLNSNSVQQIHHSLYLAGCYYYGSWCKAIRAAGLRYTDVVAKEREPYWTKERVVAKIREVYQKEGKLNSNFAQTQHAALYQRALHRFGNWGQAVEAAGFDYQSLKVRKRFRWWSKASIIAELKRRKKNRLPLSGLAVSREDPGLYHAAKRYFGLQGWDKALQKIGLSSMMVLASRIWTGEKIIREIHLLFQAKSPLNISYLTKNGYASLVGGGVKWFGSWKKAIEAAGFDYEQIRAVRSAYWKPEVIIREIKRLNRLGIRLSSKATQLTRADLFGAAVTHFGSWSQAVEAAGISYTDHSLVWSTKAWLRKLTPEHVTVLGRRAVSLAKRRRRS